MTNNKPVQKPDYSVLNGLGIPDPIIVALMGWIPFISWGKPGIGKTAMIENGMKLLGYKGFTVILSIHEPQDILGIPSPDEKRVSFKHLASEVVLQILKWNEEGYPTYIHFDELTTCSHALQAAALRVLEEKVIGNYKMPDTFIPFASANPPSIAVNGVDLSAPMANRLMHVDADPAPDNKAFLDNFGSYWGNIPNIPFLDQELWTKERSAFVGFAQKYPASVIAFPKEQSKQSGPWPSYRSWTKCTIAAAACGGDITRALKAWNGLVGNGYAMEYFTYRQENDLPDGDMLLKDPNKLDMSIFKGRADRIYTVLSTCTTLVKMNITPDRYKNLWNILGQVAKGGHRDIGGVFARQAAKFLPAGMTPPKEVMDYASILNAVNKS